MQNPWFEFADEQLMRLSDPAQSPINNRSYDFVLPADRESCDFEDIYVHLLCLQTYLPPVPYVGKPLSADIVILAANPGFIERSIRKRDNPEYQNNADFVEQSLKSLKFDSDYPNHYLDERFGAQGKTPAYPGHGWWKRVIGAVVDSALEISHGTVDRKHIVSRIAGMEWLPYHSNIFDKSPKNQKNNPMFKHVLPSQLFTRWLVEAAIERQAQLVVIYGRPHREMWEHFLSRSFPPGTIFSSQTCSVGMKELRPPYFDRRDLDCIVKRLSE